MISLKLLKKFLKGLNCCVYITMISEDNDIMITYNSGLSYRFTILNIKIKAWIIWI